MTTDAVIADIERTFSDRERPTQITRHTDDAECAQIQVEFGRRGRAAITATDAAMLIVDGQLLSDEAILYFLPALAKYVLQGSAGDILMLRLRLESLDSDSLNDRELVVMRELIKRLNEVDAEMESS